MSVQAEPIEHERSVEELLLEIIEKLQIIIRHNEELTDQEFTEEDLSK